MKNLLLCFLLLSSISSYANLADDISDVRCIVTASVGKCTVGISRGASAYVPGNMIVKNYDGSVGSIRLSGSANNYEEWRKESIIPKEFATLIFGVFYIGTLGIGPEVVSLATHYSLCSDAEEEVDSKIQNIEQQVPYCH